MVGAIAASVGAWFVLDTGLSVILGFVGHAAFNVVFAAAPATPLVAISRTPITETSTRPESDRFERLLPAAALDGTVQLAEPMSAGVGETAR